MNSEKILPTEYKYGNITVRKASVSDFPVLAKMLARAYDDEPATNWICLQDRYRTERILRLMNLALYLALPFGEIYTTQDLTGAALWIPPGKTDMRLRAVPSLLAKGIRVTGVKRGISYCIVGMIAFKHHPPIPHWRLYLFSVEPSLQGKGIGCALLQPILNQCDQGRIPAYVETAKEKNVRFYENRGFKVKERLKLPFGCPGVWCMLREPR